MVTRKFSELREPIIADPVRAERLRQTTHDVAQNYESYLLNLRQLRQAADMTQVQLAKVLGISQPEVSRIERQTDVYLSTLKSYVAAMGGDLRLVAVFGDDVSLGVGLDDVIGRTQSEPTNELTLSVATRSAPVTGSPDVSETLAVAAVGAGDQQVGALRNIVSTLRQRDMPNVACVIASMAADALASSGDTLAAAREAGTAGAAARQTRRIRLAETLWRKSLDFDPTNVRSRSALGQLMHHQGRYIEALDNLETVASMDNHAALFLGWSRLMVGLAAKNEEQIAHGINELISAMHRWAYEANRSQRASWLRQVKRLDELGRFSDTVDNLLHFASAQSNFGTVTREDLVEVEPASSDIPSPIDDVHSHTPFAP
jgi:transcriptional regulator with XRE-family HTH domain